MLKYARAGGGNWSADATWSSTSGGAADTVAPTAADDVVLDAASGNVTIDTGATRLCRSINCTGYTGTLTHQAATTLQIGDATAGTGNIALKFVAGMTYTVGNATTSLITFVSTSATVQTVDFAGKTTGSVTYNATSGGSWQLTGTHTTNVASTVTLTKGTLDTNGQTCSWGFFDSNNSNTRTLSLGASAITLTGGSGTHWNFGTTTGLTFNRGTSLITFNFTSSFNFQGGSQTYYDVVINFPGGVGANLFGANTFRNLTVTTASGTFFRWTLQNGLTQTVTGVFSASGFNVNSRLSIWSDSVGSAATINLANAGAHQLNNVDLLDIAFTGTGAPIGGSSIGNMLGCSGVTFTPAVTRYRVGVGGTWTGTANWAATSGGASGATQPLAQDTVIIDGNASGTITLGSAFTSASVLGKDIDFTGFTGAINIGGLGGLYVLGSLTYSSGMTVTGAPSVTFGGRGSHTITSAGKSTVADATFKCFGGAYSLLDAFISNGTGQVDFVCGTFNSNGFSITLGGTFQTQSANIVRAINLGTSTVTSTKTSSGNFIQTAGTAGNLTTSYQNATFVLGAASANSRTLSGGSGNFGTLTYTVAGSTGALVITGANTFGTINFSDASNARTLTLPASTITTLTGSLNAIGASGRLLTLNSSSAGTAATLSKALGIISSCDWLSIQDSTATGGAYFAAGNNSTSVSNNSGWVFGAAAFVQNFADSVTTSDQLTKAIGKRTADSVTPTDQLSKAIAKALADSVMPADSLSKSIGKNSSDSVTVAEQLSKAFGHTTADSVLATDQLTQYQVPNTNGVGIILENEVSQ